MSSQPGAAPLPVTNRKSGYKRLLVQPIYRNLHAIAYFFTNLNPFNWFNEFRNIEISMEEFSGAKK